MSTGISISSINRIKELAEEKKFAEALEILDTQNLDKSINPQFLRISGEVFRENKRYYDSRKILLKAHQMAPEGNRIIFELILLYLELGYFSKAEKYYEQYQFNSGMEDIQKDYVEYVMKKAQGADVKELASILIPILERMPEDKWNFEAVLLYDKMDRKDKALEESQYILENFKDSIYVEPVIAYIDDKLDVDKYFYVYPKEEQEEDTALFGDLIKQEEQLLEKDHLRMFPPEARILVEAEDKDAIVDTKPDKPKRSRKKNKNEEVAKEEETPDDKQKASDEETKGSVQDIINEAEQLMSSETEHQTDSEAKEKEAQQQEAEQQLKKEREAALEKLLSKRIDTDKIKESARQMAKAVKEIDTAKAKNQVMSVAETVKDNVKKATDALGEAVGTKQVLENMEMPLTQSSQDIENQIVDGIIESVLEPPKRAVGQVVMNEELDALIPDSLEAMSKKEIADIEAKKEEYERLELEALEASLQLEEEKKAKARQKKAAKAEPDIEEQEATSEASGQEENVPDNESNTPDTDIVVEGTYAELKERFLTEWTEKEEEPLESLGFISVVHSDVDAAMEEDAPDAANMLRQMIDNKEYYTGEDSTQFESKASYLNHGFEIEDYDFEIYKKEEDNALTAGDVSQDVGTETGQEDAYKVEDIYAQEQILAFEDVSPQEEAPFAEAKEQPEFVEAELQPEPIEPKPVEAEPQPEPIEAELQPEMIQPEPVEIEPEPVKVEIQPEPVEEKAEESLVENVWIQEKPVVEEIGEPEPVEAEVQPEPIETEIQPEIQPEPIEAELQPDMIQPEPVEIEPEPVKVEIQPEPVEEKAEEPLVENVWTQEEPAVEETGEPEPVEAEVQPEPIETKLQPELIEPELQPEPVEAEVQPEPIETKLQPELIEPELQPEPVEAEVQPEPIETEVQSEPIDTEIQAEPVQEKAGEVAVEEKPTIEIVDEFESVMYRPTDKLAKREWLRVRIILSDRMVHILDNLKESR